VEVAPRFECEKEEREKYPEDATKWDTISVHLNDTTISGPFAHASWKIICTKPHQFFRIIQVGPNTFDSFGGPWYF